MTLQKQFKPKEKQLLFRLQVKLKGWIFKNSKLEGERGRLSRWYDLYINLNSLWLKLNEWLRKRRKKEVEYDYLSILRNLAFIAMYTAAIAAIAWLLRDYVASIF